MSIVVSASRRTDLVAHFPERLADALREERAHVLGPYGRAWDIDLSPDNVQTIILWSKNFSSLIDNAAGLRDVIARYGQIYCHFTITGLGGTFIEEGVPESATALSQLPELIRIAGSPERLSLRFDPILFWREAGKVKTNLSFFDTLAQCAAGLGILNIRFSFAQWYGKARRRAEKRRFEFIDPNEDRKIIMARALAEKAQRSGLRLLACCQKSLSGVSGIKPSACIDGRRLKELHPQGEAVSEKKDKTQRPDCLCTESRDIGSYTQSCPHGCLYCYANPAA